MGLIKCNEIVNIETPLKLSDGLDGHIVQGHIDTVGKIVSNELIGDSWLLEVKIDKKEVDKKQADKKPAAPEKK